MPTHAIDERRALAASLRSAGPSAPTLCGDWTAAQLAAHLVLRERSVTELLGRVPVGRARAVAQRHLDAYVAAHPFEQAVADFEAGPPWYSPSALPLVRENANLLEYLIHNEDVRRAGPDWAPRPVPVERQQAIWSKLRLAARLTLRSMPFAVRLSWPSHGAITVGRGEPRVTAVGDPVELALFAFGRQAVARLAYEGEAADVTAAREATIAV